MTESISPQSDPNDIDAIRALIADLARSQAAALAEERQNQAAALAEERQSSSQKFAEVWQVVQSNAKAIAANSAAQAEERQRSSQEFAEAWQVVQSNAKAIEANSAALAELRAQLAATHALLHEEIGNLVTMSTSQSTHFAEQREQDRAALQADAEQERAERLALIAEVRALVDALGQRFAGNGHS